MVYAGIIFQQLIVLTIYVIVGYVLCRCRLLTEEGTKSIANLLLYILLPCVIVNSFCKEASREQTLDMLTALGLSAVLLLLAMAVSYLLFRRNPVDNFSASFSNVGFMGVPLISAVLGEKAVFYIAGMVAMLNILQWTYGQRLLAGNRTDMKLKKLLFNPLIVAFAIGLLLYFLQVKLPAQLQTCVQAFAACNSPVAMVLLGGYLSSVPLRRIFTTGSAYWATLARLLLIPLLSALLLAALPGVDPAIRLALLIAASTPVGTNVAVFAQRTGHSYSRAVILICQSTLFCLVTMPLVILLSSALF